MNTKLKFGILISVGLMIIIGITLYIILMLIPSQFTSQYSENLIETKNYPMVIGLVNDNLFYGEYNEIKNLRRTPDSYYVHNIKRKGDPEFIFTEKRRINGFTINQQGTKLTCVIVGNNHNILFKIYDVDSNQTKEITLRDYVNDLHVTSHDTTSNQVDKILTHIEQSPDKSQGIEIHESLNVAGRPVSNLNWNKKGAKCLTVKGRYLLWVHYNKTLRDVQINLYDLKNEKLEILQTRDVFTDIVCPVIDKDNIIYSKTDANLYLWDIKNKEEHQITSLTSETHGKKISKKIIDLQVDNNTIVYSEFSNYWVGSDMSRSTTSCFFTSINKKTKTSVPKATIGGFCPFLSQDQLFYVREDILKNNFVIYRVDMR